MHCYAVVIAEQVGGSTLPAVESTHVDTGVSFRRLPIRRHDVDAVSPPWFRLGWLKQVTIRLMLKGEIDRVLAL